MERHSYGQVRGHAKRAYGNDTFTHGRGYHSVDEHSINIDSILDASMIKRIDVVKDSVENTNTITINYVNKDSFQDVIKRRVRRGAQVMIRDSMERALP